MGKGLRIGMGALALLLSLWAWPARAADAAAAGALVNVAWLKQHLGRPDVVLVDASPASVHRQRHIPGAVLSSLFTFGPQDLPTEEIERHLGQWGVGPQHRLVVYDPGGTYMAVRLYWDLVHRGFAPERLAVLDGGLSKWVAEGGAVTAEATPKPAPANARLGTPRAEWRVRLPEFLAATAEPQRNVMLEALQPAYFYGGAAFFNRGGHVPHATLMPAEDFFNEDKTFKAPAEMQRMLDHLGVRRDRQVLTYCGGGGAAAVPWFALTQLLGYPRVRLFQESQFGWLQDSRELPLWTYADPHLTRDTAWLKAWASPMLKAFGLSQVSVVDVRSPEAFQLGHVPLAVNLPLALLQQQTGTPQALARLLGQAGVNPAHEAVVVADGGLNESAALAFVLLESAGQRKASILLDSVERWAELGQAVVRTAAPAAPALAYEAAPRNSPFTHEAAAANSRFGRVYLAVGPAMPSSRPAGRVLHLPYTQLLNSDGTPKPAKDIWTLLEKAGVPRYAEIVVLGDAPGEAAVGYVVLRMMGLADVKIWQPSRG